MGNQQIKQLNRTRLRVTHTGEWRGSFHLSMHARRMDIVRVTEGLLFISKFLVQTTYGAS